MKASSIKHLAHCRATGVGRADSPRLVVLTTLLVAAGCLGATAAMATPATDQGQSDQSLQPIQGAAPAPSSAGLFATLAQSSNLLGDMGGLRPFLSKYGATLSLTETSEVLGNLTGGVRRGFEYDGLTTMGLQVDTDRAGGWYGGTFNASALQIHGRDLSADNLHTLQTSSGIEADRATRLWELWYDQKFLDEDRLDVKIGQQSLDQEFIVSQNALLFVNTMFGWPMVPSADLPGGGPAYPLSAPGIRARFKATDSFTLLAGVFNGSPTRNNIGDPQQTNPSGTSFPLNGGALAIAEIQYAYPSSGTMLYADQPPPMARSYKLGVWYDSERFADLRYDNTGLSLANPLSTGVPRTHQGDYSIYGVVDQELWQDSREADRTLNFFARAMGTPQDDRNLVDFSLNAGLTMHEPILHRDDDTVGIGMGYAHVSAAAAGLDSDTAAFSGSFFPVRSGETYVEATYQYQVTPWWQLQPDIQYVITPGAGILEPGSASDEIRNEMVVGLRTNITF